MRDDLYRALDQRLQDIRSTHWGRGFQLANEEDRRKCIEQVMSLVEPALEMADLEIVHKPIIPGAYLWQHDRDKELSEEDFSSTNGASEVDSTNDTRGKGISFHNGLC